MLQIYQPHPPPTPSSPTLSRDIRDMLVSIGRHGIVGVVALGAAALLYVPVAIVVRAMKAVIEGLTLGGLTVAPATPPPSRPVVR